MNNQKIRIIVLSCIFLLGITYTVYQYFGLSDEYDITDKDALNALKWLSRADNGDFEECKKNTAVNMNKCFDLFQKNRKSLGELNSRSLKSKALDKKGVYKIVFNSSFKNALKIYETIWISKDAKVWQVKYLYANLRMPRPRWRSKDFGTYSENKEIEKIAYQVIKAMKTLDVEFFDKIGLRNQGFGAGKKIVNNIRRQHKIVAAPYKYQLAKKIRYTRTFPGRTELEGAIVYVSCVYQVRGKARRRGIAFILYKDNSKTKPHWEIYKFMFGRLKRN